MHDECRLLAALADGGFRQAADLGRSLGVTAAAVDALVSAAVNGGAGIVQCRERGYRLARPLELLSEDTIRDALVPRARENLAGLEVLATVDSTNRHLLQRPAGPGTGAYACFAEHQWAGRGRRGRTWWSPFASNVYMSVRRRFEVEPREVQTLGLAMGVAAARAVEAAGIGMVGLKWPNDVVFEDRKLAGILVERDPRPDGVAGSMTVVVGIGVNVRMPAVTGSAGDGRISQPWTDVETVRGAPVSRNRLAAGLLSETLVALDGFEGGGFEPFRAGWGRRDAARGRAVVLSAGSRTVAGRACGIDGAGALLLSVDGRRQRFLSGNVSLRIAP